jgi:hypothetical protein
MLKPAVLNVNTALSKAKHCCIRRWMLYEMFNIPVSNMLYTAIYNNKHDERCVNVNIVQVVHFAINLQQWSGSITFGLSGTGSGSFLLFNTNMLSKARFKRGVLREGSPCLILPPYSYTITLPTASLVRIPYPLLK